MAKTFTNDDLLNASKQVDSDAVYGGNEKLLANMFEMFPNNDNVVITTMKIGLIDTLYSTHLNSSQQKTTLIELAEVITSNEINFDERVKNGDVNVVHDILEQIGHNPFSFLSKYVTLHDYHVYNHDNFAIYDGIVSEHIYEYVNQDKYPKIKSAHSAQNIIKNKEDYVEWVKLLDDILDENSISVENRKRRFDWYVWGSNKGLVKVDSE
jgi:hypothetical protein